MVVVLPTLAGEDLSTVQLGWRSDHDGDQPTGQAGDVMASSGDIYEWVLHEVRGLMASFSGGSLEPVLGGRMRGDDHYS
eukprot:c43375_g1_i1 orf=2-235(-)